MSETIEITASLRIERPVDEVRAQYRDIDHHIRNNVHPGIHYEWEPAEPGQRKIRTTFRILSVPQFDVSLLEDAEDGSFLIRYLEGTNAGMLLVHKFVPITSDATDVQLFANAPATMGRRLMGPLFVLGARQVMKKALAEDKRDLEGGAYVPGIAAGDLERAMAPAENIKNRDGAVKRAALEAACLVSVADGEVDLAEVDAIRRLARVANAEKEMPWVQQRLTELTVLAQGERIASVADQVGTSFAEAGIASEGVTLAAVVGLVSQGLSLGELSILRRISNGAGLSEQTLSDVIEQADAALMRA